MTRPMNAKADWNNIEQHRWATPFIYLYLLTFFLYLCPFYIYRYLFFRGVPPAFAVRRAAELH